MGWVFLWAPCLIFAECLLEVGFMGGSWMGLVVGSHGVGFMVGSVSDFCRVFARGWVHGWVVDGFGGGFTWGATWGGFSGGLSVCFLQCYVSIGVHPKIQV